MFRPPISYFVLALFSYKFRLRASVHVGWLQQRLFQARTGLAANILRLPFATASACWLKNYECNHVNYECNHVVLRKKMPSVQKLQLPK